MSTNFSLVGCSITPLDPPRTLDSAATPEPAVTSLHSVFVYPILMVVAAILTAVSTGIILLWTKHPVRWLLIVLTILIILFTLAFKLPPIDEQLPGTFRSFFKFWMLVLGLGGLYAATHFGVMLYRYLKGSEAEASALTGKYPEIDAAWQEILIRLNQARMELPHQRLYLLLGPDEAAAEELVQASRTPLFARAPGSAESPIHAFATSDGLLLSCAGASALGRQDPEGSDRLLYLCNLIRSLNPEMPILRGVAVLIPYEWVTGADSLRRVAAVRDDLQTIRSTLRLRAPVLAILCVRDSQPGFNEFVARMPETWRRKRCGFSVPSTLPFSADVVRRGTPWLVQWFQSWVSYLMVQDIRNDEGNGRLFHLLLSLRKNRNNIAGLLESAFTTHHQAGPVLFRGCYIVACGPESEKHAFAPGLLESDRSRKGDASPQDRRPKGGLLSEYIHTTWSREALRVDRGSRLVALGLGLATALIAAPIWYVGIIQRLGHNGLGRLGWLGVAFLLVVWVVGLLAPPILRRLNRTPAAA